MRSIALASLLLAIACETQRTEYHYRPDYVAINQGRPLEESYVRPDGTRVVITSRVPGLEEVPASAKETSAGDSEPTAPGAPARLQIFTPDMVVETFMQGLRDQDYTGMYDHLVSPQQRERMGGERGRAEFADFCERNRRELMASSIRLVSSIRGSTASVTVVSGDMTRYQLPEADRGQFGFTILEVERTGDGSLRLSGIR